MVFCYAAFVQTFKKISFGHLFVGVFFCRRLYLLRTLFYISVQLGVFIACNTVLAVFLIISLKSLLEESEQVEVVSVTGDCVGKELLGMRFNLSCELLISMLEFINQTAQLRVKMIFNLVVRPKRLFSNRLPALQQP